MVSSAAMIPYAAARHVSAMPAWHHQPGVFTPPECSGLAPAIGPREVGSDDQKARWLFERIMKPVAEWNEAGFGFELYGLERLAINAHHPGPPTPWRTGFGPGPASEHKIGILVALSGPDTSDGKLEFFENDSWASGERLAAGDAVIFPAFLQHRIGAIRSGIFWTLEAWFVGPPFR